MMDVVVAGAGISGAVAACNRPGPALSVILLDRRGPAALARDEAPNLPVAPLALDRFTPPGRAGAAEGAAALTSHG